MASVHAPDTLPGRVPGEGFGLSVRVVHSAVASGSRVSDGSFGWSGAYGTHFWVDPEGRSHRDHDDPDAGARHAPGVRERGDAGDHQVANNN